jgi:hyperosmotically inducible protein
MRCLFRLAFFGALLAGGAYLLGYRWEDAAGGRVLGAGAGAAADALAERIDGERIREAGAGIAGRIGDGAGRAEAALGEARLTAKIKAKMALDDTLDENDIDIDTDGTVVTLQGSVTRLDQRQRALQLARETDGVTSVVDRIELKQP